MIEVKRAVPIFQLYPSICLTNGKKAEDLRQGSWLVLDTNRCVDLAAFLGPAPSGMLSMGLPRLLTSDFSQPLDSTSTFQVAELRSFHIR
jgi:hypothetical protein